MSYRDQKAALRAITAIAASQGGYFTARQASEVGYAYPHLSYHLSAGNFERAGRGLYRIPTLPYSEHDDLVRISFWSRGRDDAPQAVVSHQTALALHDLAEFIPTVVHLTVPASFRRPAPKGCTLHKAAVARVDTQEVGALRVTTPLRTLADLAGDPSIPREQFDRAVKEASSRGMIRRSQADELRATRKSSIRTNTIRTNTSRKATPRKTTPRKTTTHTSRAGKRRA
jgi:predicted transcriptional regulator of viral defense system